MRDPDRDSPQLATSLTQVRRRHEVACESFASLVLQAPWEITTTTHQSDHQTSNLKNVLTSLLCPSYNAQLPYKSDFTDHNRSSFASLLAISGVLSSA